MKKSVIISVCAISAVLLFAGCKKQDATPAANNNPSDTGNPQASGQQNPDRGNRGANFTPPDLNGEITAINGNSLDLKLIETPQFQPGQGGQGGGRRGGNPPDGQNDQGQQANPNMQRNNDTQTTGTPGQGQNGNQRRGSGNRPQPPVKYTGVNETITIPSGVQMTEMVRPPRLPEDQNQEQQQNPNQDQPQNPPQGRGPGPNGAPQTKNVELKDLKVGDVVQVWYSDKAAKTISRISVRPARPEAATDNQTTKQPTTAAKTAN